MKTNLGGEHVRWKASIRIPGPWLAFATMYYLYFSREGLAREKDEMSTA
jgi:hypothetical protein